MATCVCSIIFLPSMLVSEHTIYQMKAEYHSYSVVPAISLFIKK